MSGWTNIIKAAAPAAICCLGVIGAPLLALAEPIQGDQAAAVFPPSWTESDVLVAAARADLSVVRFGAFPNVGIIQFDTKDALAALRREGALFLLSPGALGGCFILTASPSHFDDTSTNRG